MCGKVNASQQELKNSFVKDYSLFEPTGLSNPIPKPPVKEYTFFPALVVELADMTYSFVRLSELIAVTNTLLGKAAQDKALQRVEQQVEYDIMVAEFRKKLEDPYADEQKAFELLRKANLAPGQSMEVHTDKFVIVRNTFTPDTSDTQANSEERGNG